MVARKEAISGNRSLIIHYSRMFDNRMCAEFTCCFFLLLDFLRIQAVTGR